MQSVVAVIATKLLNLVSALQKEPFNGCVSAAEIGGLVRKKLQVEENGIDETPNVRFCAKTLLQTVL